MNIKNKMLIGLFGLFVNMNMYSMDQGQMNTEELSETLFYASYWGDWLSAKQALKAGADPNWLVTQRAINLSDGKLTRYDLGRPPLFKNHNQFVMKLLLDYGGNVNFVDPQGQTSLYRAVYYNNLSAVRVLLDYRVDHDVIDQEVVKLEAREHRTEIQNQILNLLYDHQVDTTLK